MYRRISKKATDDMIKNVEQMMLNLVDRLEDGTISKIDLSHKVKMIDGAIQLLMLSTPHSHYEKVRGLWDEIDSIEKAWRNK